MRDYFQRRRCVEGGWERWKISNDRARRLAEREAEREYAEAEWENEQEDDD